jgi:hypothetical protein
MEGTVFGNKRVRLEAVLVLFVAFVAIKVVLFTDFDVLDNESSFFSVKFPLKRNNYD